MTSSKISVPTFRVGDIVRCNPSEWSTPMYLSWRMKVYRLFQNVGGITMVSIIWPDGSRGDLPHYEFILAEESIIDRVLTKYQKELEAR